MWVWTAAHRCRERGCLTFTASEALQGKTVFLRHQFLLKQTNKQNIIETLNGTHFKHLEN